MKKLKGLKNRVYHVMFHTHTVAGIVISFALFVIFYAGAFSLFRHEIAQWENPFLRKEYQEDVDIDKALEKVDGMYAIDREKSIYITPPNRIDPNITISASSKNTHIDTTKTTYFETWVSPSLEVMNVEEARTTVADTMYGLHFFAQLGMLGQFIAGFVGLFFFFAIISGILIHWSTLLTKFYAFVKEGRWKLIWTNAHTVLGVIGIPFQIMYAVTGAFFGIVALVIIFYAAIGKHDLSEAEAQVVPYEKIQLDEHSPDSEHLTINELYKGIRTSYPEYRIRYLTIKNYGKEDALAIWSFEDFKGVSSKGDLPMYMKDGIILDEYSVFPYNKTYGQHVYNYTHTLHYGNFGGYLIKVLFFVLSLVTCFIIISGILIWRTARNNKKYTFKQRLFHHRVTKCYLAICLSMFPAFALLFIANKLVPMGMPDRTSTVNAIFFIGWLLLTIYGLFINNYSKQNRNYLLLGGILSLLVPTINGIVTGDWFWKTILSYPWVFYVDMFWTFTGIVAVYASIKVEVKQGSDKPVEVDRSAARISRIQRIDVVTK